MAAEQTIPLRTAAQSDVLSEKAMRYKRAAMVLGMSVGAVHLTSFFDFEHLNIFGLQLAQGAPSKRVLVLGILWAALIYNTVWASYYCWRDYRRWRMNLTDRWDTMTTGTARFFPELRMYFEAGAPADADQSIQGRMLGGYEFAKWNIEVTPSHVDVVCMAKDRSNPHVMTTRSRFSVSRTVMNTVRETFRAVVLLDILPALACLVVAVVGLSVDIWR